MPLSEVQLRHRFGDKWTGIGSRSRSRRLWLANVQHREIGSRRWRCSFRLEVQHGDFGDMRLGRRSRGDRRFGHVYRRRIGQLQLR